MRKTFIAVSQCPASIHCQSASSHFSRTWMESRQQKMEKSELEFFPAFRAAFYNVQLPGLRVTLARGIGDVQDQGRRESLEKARHCVGREPALNTEAVPNCTFLRGLFLVTQVTQITQILGCTLVDPGSWFISDAALIKQVPHFTHW